MGFSKGKEGSSYLKGSTPNTYELPEEKIHINGKS